MAGKELARRVEPMGLPAVSEVDLMASAMAALKPASRLAYGKDLKDFARFVGLDSGSAAANLLISGAAAQANILALRYKEHLINRQLSPATVNRRLTALRAIATVAATVGRIEWSLRIKGVKSEAREDRRGPDDSNWRAMLATAEAEAAGGKAKPVRDLCALRLLHDMALRRGEVAALDLCDVDLADRNVWIVGKGKREKQRLSVPAPTLAVLSRWIAARGDEPGPLLIRLDRGATYQGIVRLEAESINATVKAIGARAGVARRTRAHGMRHASITLALDKGHDIRQVRKFSRHASIEMVAKYDDAREDTFGQIASDVAEHCSPQVHNWSLRNGSNHGQE